jgi:hypothetical protein
MLAFTDISQDVTVYKQAKSAFCAGKTPAAFVSVVARNSTAAQLHFKATQAVLYPQLRHDGFCSSCSLYCNQNKPPMDIPYNAESLRRGGCCYIT